MLTVVVTSPERVLFDGSARRVVFPGEKGTFEVLPLHRPLVSRLVGGVIEVDDQPFRVRRGIVRIADDVVTVVVELPAGLR